MKVKVNVSLSFKCFFLFYTQNSECLITGRLLCTFATSYLFIDTQVVILLTTFFYFLGNTFWSKGIFPAVQPLVSERLAASLNLSVVLDETPDFEWARAAELSDTALFVVFLRFCVFFNRECLKRTSALMHASTDTYLNWHYHPVLLSSHIQHMQGVHYSIRGTLGTRLHLFRKNPHILCVRLKPAPTPLSMGILSQFCSQQEEPCGSTFLTQRGDVWGGGGGVWDHGGARLPKASEQERRDRKGAKKKDEEVGDDGGK